MTWVACICASVRDKGSVDVHGQGGEMDVAAHPKRFSSRCSAILAIAYATLALLTLHIPGHGYSDFALDYNHAELKWHTLETGFLRVHYFEGHRRKAEEIARIAENLCGIFQKRYGIVLPGKTDVVVRDSDMPGGWVAPVLNLVSIDVHEFDYRLRGTSRWLENVVAHEFAHLYSIRSGLRFPTWMPDIRLGYFDYINEKSATAAFHVLSSDIMPQWFVEGLAQVEAFREGTDSWDTHRDMLLRVSTLEDQLLSFDEMGVFSGKGTNFEKAYNQGFSLVSYIADTYGHEAVVSMFRESALVFHQSFKPVIRRVLGIPAKDLYGEWKRLLKARYEKQISGIGQQVYGEKLTKKGFNTAYPRWSSDGKELYFVSNYGRDYGFRSLFKYDFGDTAKEHEKKIKPVLGIGSIFALSPDNKRIMHISSKKRDENRWPRRDLYIQDVKPPKRFGIFGKNTETRLTKNLSVLYADLAPDSLSIALVKKNGPCDYLAMMDMDNKKPRYIFPEREIVSNDSAKEYNIYTPRISPEGNRVVFSYWDGKARQIGLIDTAGTTFYTLFRSGFDDRDPSWSADGEWVLFSSDRSGIFNVYKKNIKTGKVVQVTNVAGGAFYPEMSPDGKRVAYINYDKTGFSLYVLPDTALQEFPDQPIAVEEVQDSLPPLKSLQAPVPYDSKPRRLLVSPLLLAQEILNLGEEVREGEARWFGGAVLNLMDPLDKHYIAMLVLLQLNNGFDIVSNRFDNLINPAIDKEFSLYYQNRSLPPTLAGEFILRTIHDSDRFWNWDAGENGDSTQLDYQISMIQGGIAPRYQLTPSQKIHFLADAYSSSTYFHSLEFFPRFRYFTGFRTGLMWTMLSQARNTAGSIAPQGKYLKLKLDHWENELIKDGTLGEALTIESGVIKAVTNPYPFNMATLSLKYGMPNPLYGKHIIGLQASASLLDRNIHSFFEVGPYLKGYPFLRSRDSLYTAGSKSFQMELDYSVPLVKRFGKSFSFLYLNQLYAMGFVEAGGAWNLGFGELGQVSPDDFLKSAGLELRLECISHQVYPLAVILRGAYGLDHPVKEDRLRTFFGLSFSFDNWELIDIPDFLSRSRPGIVR